MQPMVIVTTDRIEHNALAWSATPAPYLEAVATVGCLPVQLPTLEAPIGPAALLAAASGVVLTGARSNVHPDEYGGGDEEATAPFDRARDRTTIPLIRAALAAGVPLLAICRGFQELNVALGGTLHAAIHELPGRHDHRGTSDVPDERFALAHEVHLEPSGMLAGILGPGPVTVNSVHRQGIDRLADGLDVEARAADGTIEAVSVRGARAFALGVQWHPEYLVRSDRPSRAILDAFATAARAHAELRRRAAA